MILLLLSGFLILTFEVYMLYCLLKHEKAVINISVPHKVLLNGKVEVELEELSALWMDKPRKVTKTIPKDPAPAKVEQKSDQEVAEWHKKEDFVQFLKNCINDHINLCSGVNFNAFSFNGIVYLTPSALWSYTNLYLKAKGIEQKDKNKQNTMLLVVDSLNKSGLVKSNDIRNGSYTAVYLITASKKDTKLKPKGVYIPLIAEHFKTDNKKEGILTFISNVELYKDVSDAE